MKKLRLTISADDYQMGNANAKVTLIEYGDYKYSHLGWAHPIVQMSGAELRDNLHFVSAIFH
jgi:protein-disulfide isomerase